MTVEQVQRAAALVVCVMIGVTAAIWLMGGTDALWAWMIVLSIPMLIVGGLGTCVVAICVAYRVVIGRWGTAAHPPVWAIVGWPGVLLLGLSLMRLSGPIEPQSQRPAPQVQYVDDTRVVWMFNGTLAYAIQVGSSGGSTGSVSGAGIPLGSLTSGSLSGLSVVGGSVRIPDSPDYASGVVQVPLSSQCWQEARLGDPMPRSCADAAKDAQP